MHLGASQDDRSSLSRVWEMVILTDSLNRYDDFVMMDESRRKLLYTDSSVQGLC